MCMITAWAKPVSKKAAQQVAHEFMMRQLSVQGSHRAPQMVAVEVEQATGINTLRMNDTPTSAAYNLSGQRVADDYRGIVIQNGQKQVRK